MDWTIEPTGHHTLAMGSCTANVWLAGKHGFAAHVTNNGMSTAQYGFASLEDAQGWCLTQLAALQVAGKCENVTTVAHG